MHRLRAKTRHGTHSPFVYRLIDEVIYANCREAEPVDKVDRLVKRLVERFRPAVVYTPGSIPARKIPIDLATIDCTSPRVAADEVKALWPRLHAGSLLVLRGCHRNASANALWRSIKAKREVTVTIDLFYVGLVFFHAGQAKEDFKIRY